MSHAALNWAWTADVPPSAKLVLVCLADRADAEGECFPSVGDIVRRTGLGERTIQRELNTLERAGLLQRRHRTMKSTYYVLSVGKDCDRGATMTPPATVAPPATMTPRGATVAPITITEPEVDKSTSYREGALFAQAAPTAPPSASPTRERTGHRLPENWQPEEPGFAGVNADTVLPKFRDYWHAQPGAKGRKLDWQATWRNWCRREAERQPARAGKSSQWPVADQNAEMMRLLARARAEEETQPLFRSIA